MIVSGSVTAAPRYPFSSSVLIRRLHSVCPLLPSPLTVCPGRGAVRRGPPPVAAALSSPSDALCSLSARAPRGWLRAGPARGRGAAAPPAAPSPARGRAPPVAPRAGPGRGVAPPASSASPRGVVSAPRGVVSSLRGVTSTPRASTWTPRVVTWTPRGETWSPPGPRETTSGEKIPARRIYKTTSTGQQAA